MADPVIVAHNLHLIGGNGIVAIADLQVIHWGATLLRCFWKRENGRDRIALPGITLRSEDDAYRFQQAALGAMRAVAEKMLEDPAP